MSTLFSVVATAVYNPANSEQRAPFLPSFLWCRYILHWLHICLRVLFSSLLGLHCGGSHLAGMSVVEQLGWGSG